MPILFPVNCERNVLFFVKLMQNPLSHRKTKLQSKSFTCRLTHFRYMLTEIGSRDLGDQQRYNMLEVSGWSMTHVETLFPVFSPSCPGPDRERGPSTWEPGKQVCLGDSFTEKRNGRYFQRKSFRKLYMVLVLFWKRLYVSKFWDMSVFNQSITWFQNFPFFFLLKLTWAIKREK